MATVVAAAPMVVFTLRPESTQMQFIELIVQCFFNSYVSIVIGL